MKILWATSSKGQAGASTEYLKHFCFSNILIPVQNMKEIIQNSLVWWYVNFELWLPKNSDPTETGEYQIWM